MRNRARCIGFVMLVMMCRTAPALAQYDLQGGIQDLVQQMVASMEQQKQKLAIVDFTNLDGLADNFGRYLSERLITTFVLTRRVEVVERKQLSKLLAEQELGLSGLIDPHQVKRVGRLAGVDGIVIGSVSVLPTAVEVHARLIETETGRILATAVTRIRKGAELRALLDGATEILSTGIIDWPRRVIRVQGFGVADTAFPSQVWKRAAEEAAKVDAQTKLLEAVNGLRIESRTFVRNYQLTLDEKVKEIRGRLKDVKQVGPTVYPTPDTAEVVMELRLD